MIKLGAVRYRRLRVAAIVVDFIALVGTYAFLRAALDATVAQALAGQAFVAAYGLYSYVDGFMRAKA